VQRYLCRDCGYRFSKPKVKVNVSSQVLESPNSKPDLSDNGVISRGLSFKEPANPLPFKGSEDIASHKQPLKTNAGKSLYALSDYNRNCRVCASEGEAKNLAESKTRTHKRAAGATEKLSDAEVRGKIVEYGFWLLKQGFAESTIEGRSKLLKRLIKLGANLYDPESVKEVIAKQEKWSEGRKELAVEAYSSFLLMTGAKWDPPKYRRIRKLPFIPTETEIDQLIAGCGKKMSVFLQTLKETGARAGEVWKLKWTDVDCESRAMRITAEKGSDPRILRISQKLLDMLSALPKTSVYVFGGYPLRGFARSFQRSRKLIAKKLGNPRLLQITFHTFRHWKATMEYAKTRDILHVMKTLGHRNIKNTLIYTQLIDFKDDEYACKAAKTVEEATKLIESGFEYVTEIEGLKLFRKRK